MSELYEAIVRGDVKVAVEATRQALDSGAAALELVNREMVPAMDEVGRRSSAKSTSYPDAPFGAGDEGLDGDRSAAAGGDRRRAGGRVIGP